MDESNEEVFGDQRLRGAGIGSVVGGLLLGVLSVFLSFEMAATAVLFVGIFGWFVERKEGKVAGSGLGVMAVGGVGLLETTFTLLGIGPLLFAAFAVAAGVLDMTLGKFFAQLRQRHQ